MAVSIAHRVSGVGLATVGALLMTWWLMALAGGKSSYDAFMACATPWYGKTVLVGLTWGFFQHFFSGVRHFILDMGAGYELKGNRQGAILVFVLAIVATALAWGLMYGLPVLMGDLK